MIARYSVWIIAPFLFLITPKILSGWPLIMGISSWFSRNLNQFPKWISASVPLWFGFFGIVSIAWAAFPDVQLDFFMQRLPGLFVIAFMVLTLSITQAHYFQLFHAVWRRLVPITLWLFLVIMVSFPHHGFVLSDYNRMFVIIAVLSAPIIAQFMMNKGIRGAVYFYILLCGVLYLSESSAAFSVALLSLPLYLLSTRFFNAVKIVFMLFVPFFIIIMPFVMPYVWDWAQTMPMLNNLSTGGRLEIWYGLSTIISQHWGYGLGYDVTRFLDLPINHVFFTNEATTHAHNMAIQMWIEFGIIGALALALVWFELIRRASTPIMVITLFSLFMIGSLSYGVWQNDWLGLCVFAWFYARNVQDLSAKTLGSNIQ